MTKPKPPGRKLHSGHFAFMRALAQGVDERASWDRYLRIEGEHTDLRTVRRTVAWIRDEFAAAARRERRPGTARLILLDPGRIAAAPALPTLEEFAQARGMEDFSEADQLEAYEEAYPQRDRGARGGSGQPTRRARVIARQLEALRWLQDLVAQDPRPGDSVSAWLNPSMAVRLEHAGLPTLASLVDHINALGPRWWVGVAGVGQLKAWRLLDWLHANEDVLGLRVGRHAVQPRKQWTQALLASVVPVATALCPYEKFLVPQYLDGRAGLFRAPQHQCRLLAATDHEAVGVWLASKSGVQGAVSSTQRAYRKEAERLLLWSVLQRTKALSSLTPEDAMDYCAFLADPPLAWCGPRHQQRWSPLWRPLEGALAPPAVRQSVIILRSLFRFLVQQRYLVHNPFDAIALSPTPQHPLGSTRTLSFEQWDHIDAFLKKPANTEAERRARRAIRWIYATGLRLAEISRAKCEDLEQIDSRGADGLVSSEWLLTVVGRRGRRRKVPVPSQLVDELGDELVRHGLERRPDAIGNRDIHVLGRFEAESDQPRAWSASGLHQAIKTSLANAAAQLDGNDARQLTKASAHWLRHSHGFHALQGRAGTPPTPIEVVQNSLGHASVETTALYLRSNHGEMNEGSGH